MRSTGAGKRIAVLGEALVDRFPDRDVLGGAPFNVARNLAAWGLAPVLVSRLGDDGTGRQIRGECQRLGVDTRGLQTDAGHPTGTVNVHMQGTHHEFEVLQDQAWDHLDAAEAVRAVVAAQPAVVYFGTLGQRSPVSRRAIQSALQASNAARFLDLNLRAGNDNRALSADSLVQADLVKVNDEELAQLLGWFIHPEAQGYAWGRTDQREAVVQLIQRFALRRLIVTRGPQGWASFDATGEVIEGPSAPVQLRDTVGAGDAFSSVVLLGEVSRWPLPVTLARAAEFASSVCAIQGAFDDTLSLYEAAARRWQSP
jgi:fructokinase